MSWQLVMWAPGVPIAKGNVRFARGRYYDTARGLKGWMRTIGMAARIEMGPRPLYEIPLVVGCSFWIPRPRGHYTTDKRTKLCKDAPAFPTVERTGDYDKLERAVFDALAGIVYKSDALVLGTDGGMKHYWPDDDTHDGPGVLITVRPAHG